MKIESVDFFYLSMPVVTDAGDGSQDALVVRVRAGGIEAWGECEASPLTSIASFVCPMSHGACRPISASVLGEDVSSPADIARIAATIQWNSMDLLQAAHTWSGVEIALWDLLGKKRGEPVYKLLGYDRAYPKTPYASQLFGDTAQETLEFCRAAREAGFRAVKCGWGPFGRGTLQDDADQLAAAREGIGPDGILLIDAGQIWNDGCRRGGGAPAAAGRRQGDLAGGAVQRQRLRGLWRAGEAAELGEAGGRRGGAQHLHGEAHHRYRQGRLHPDRLRPHRRHRAGETGGGLCGGEGRHVRESHLHLSPRALRLDPALRRIVGAPDLRVSGEAAADGVGDVQDPHRAGQEWRDPRAGGAGPRHRASILPA